MTIRNKSKLWSTDPDPEISRAMVDPWAALAAAVILAALADYTNPDPIKALDAFAWLVYGDGSDYLAGLELEETGGILKGLRRVRINAIKDKISRHNLQHNKRHVRAGAGSV